MLVEYEDIAAKLSLPVDKVQEYKEATTKFFDYLFKYNPEQHVRSSYQEPAKTDVDRTPLSKE